MAVSDQFVLCKASLIYAVIRWILSFFLDLFTNSTILSPTSESQNSLSRSSRCSSSDNLRMLRENLSLTTLRDIEQRLCESCDKSCAVCLNKLKKKSQVWELRNCNHVFHKHCLESWLAYDNRLSCPLCRSCLVTVSAVPTVPQPQQPSWEVEHMLYLFGDDFLP